MGCVQDKVLWQTQWSDFLSQWIKSRKGGIEGVQFAQHDDDEGSGAKVYCFKCGKEGFTTRDCPKCKIEAIAASKGMKKKKKANNSGFGAFQS